MGRRPREVFEGSVHHVMNRGVNRQRVFFGDIDRIEFGRQLAAAHADFGLETLAYCLMDNHYHLLVRAAGGELSAAMRELGSRFTRAVNRRIGRDGPLFRGRFTSIPVTTDAYLRHATRYIHRNALDMPGVASPERYRWSSYRTYLGLRPCPNWLDTRLVLGLFDDDPARLAGYTAAAAPFADGSPGPDELRLLLRLAVAADDLRYGDDAVPVRWHERTVAVLIASQTAAPSLAAAADGLLDFPSRAARDAALRRARRRIDDPAVRRILRSTLEPFEPHAA